MRAPKLNCGDTIGIVSPCTAPWDSMRDCISAIEAKGFRVKPSANLFRSTYGYAASEEERAEDFNSMVADEEVKMILFSGGTVCNEVLPLIDFGSIQRHPKLICSYSDGSTLTNAIYAKTGLVTYNGQDPGTFLEMTDYNHRQFVASFLEEGLGAVEKAGPWKTIRPGVCEGTLIGGYTQNFALLLGGRYFPYDRDKEYILFLEDHERYSWPARVSMLLSHVEQSGFLKNVAGFLFGHYAEQENTEILAILDRFARRNQIPVAACDDFGHGRNQAIFPIGAQARLDTGKQELELLAVR